MARFGEPSSRLPITHTLLLNLSTQFLSIIHVLCSLALSSSLKDPSCVFPLETLRRLRAAGDIGALPENVFSVMGANYSTRTVQQKLAPAVVEAMAAEGVDVVLVVPM